MRVIASIVVRGALLIFLVASCNVARPTFLCDEWTDCGPGGACEPGFNSCSYADESCLTGRRFSSIADEPFQDTCVPIVPEAAAGGLCEVASTCGRFRKCIGGRCLSADTLEIGRKLACARCSNSAGPGAPLWCWGETALFAPFAPRYFVWPGHFCGTDPNYCPSECASCPNDPCPVSCRGTDTTLEHTVGDNHLCWFNDRTYCLGDNSSLQTGAPNPGGLTNFQLGPVYELLAAGVEHTCGRGFVSNRVFCWGDNTYGQLDGNPGADSATPLTFVPFPTGAGETQIGVFFLAAAGEFSCAASNDRVVCWGMPPWGAGEVSGLGAGQIIDLDVGANHACVVKGGRAMCWGGNRFGQAAPIALAAMAPATDVLPGIEVMRVVTGGQHSCAITKQGAVYCWGASADDQLDGSTGPGPVLVSTDPPAVGPIAAGEAVTCTIHADDRTRCWGQALEHEGTRYDDFVVCGD